LIKSLKNNFYTIKYLKPGQIFYRLLKKVRHHTFSVQETPLKYDEIYLTYKTGFIHYDHYNTREGVLKNRFKFLNREVDFGKRINWDTDNVPVLWKYNLNYFNYIFLLNEDEQVRICKNWIKSNTGSGSVGWNPYVVSLRIVSWCKQNIKDKEIIESIYSQAFFLYRNIEYHTLGNHLLENARALIFAGTFFRGQGESEKWLKKGMSIFETQISEQILDDGGHFELSPMYHNLMLELMLDIINILPEKDPVLQQISFICKKMSDFTISITKPSGEIPLLNDSSANFAPDTQMLLKYANEVLSYKPKLKYKFDSSGYFMYKDEKIYIVIDGGQIGPDYLPAHAHADIFNYELSLGGMPIIVDSGVYEYEQTELRQYCRSTPAHNTVSVDSKDQAELWASFRVARRYKPNNVAFSIDHNGFYFSGTFGGYGKLIGDKIEHVRKISFGKTSNKIIVEDFISGKNKHVVSSFVHLHPNISVEATENQIILIGPGLNCEINTLGNSYKIRDSFYFPGYGIKLKNKVIEITSEKLLPVTLQYEIRIN